jgi:hypothetical protein
MSHGVSLADLFRCAASYVDKILKRSRAIASGAADAGYCGDGL